MAEKFSNFIRSPGTAGPPTQEGIKQLGFVLEKDINPIIAKTVRVDTVQSFTGPEKSQARSNIGAVIGTDVQAYSASLASLAGLTTSANKIAYTTASNVWAVTTFTAYARSLLDDPDALSARTTLGLGNVDNTSDANKPVSTATQTALNLKANLASPAFTGAPTTPTAPPGTNTTQIASTAFVVANAGALTKSYGSAEQTITSGGGLTLAHGLGAKARLYQMELVCKTAELGFAVGDAIAIQPGADQADTNSVTKGLSVISDATNIHIRFVANTNVFGGLNKSTGAVVTFTNANWRLVVRAWA